MVSAEASRWVLALPHRPRRWRAVRGPGYHKRWLLPYLPSRPGKPIQKRRCEPLRRHRPRTRLWPNWEVGAVVAVHSGTALDRSHTEPGSSPPNPAGRRGPCPSSPTSEGGLAVATNWGCPALTSGRALSSSPHLVLSHKVKKSAALPRIAVLLGCASDLGHPKLPRPLVGRIIFSNT